MPAQCGTGHLDAVNQFPVVSLIAVTAQKVRFSGVSVVRKTPTGWSGGSRNRPDFALPGHGMSRAPR